MASPPNASVPLNDGNSVPAVGLGVWQTPADDTERATDTGEQDKAPTQALIRWHVRLGNIVIPKSVNPERIVSNFDVFDFELGEQKMVSIASLDDGTRLSPDPRTLNFTG